MKETSTQVQPIGMSTFRKVPDAYQSFIPAELKDQVDAFYGSNSPIPYVLGILSHDGESIDIVATKSHPFYSNLG